MATPVKLEVSPLKSMMDEKVEFRAGGLPVWKQVTLVAVVVDDNNVFVSHGFYVTDFSGQLNLTRSPSHGGSYRGIKPMGLLWSLKSAASQKHDVRLLKKDVAAPLVVELSLLLGHIPVVSTDDISMCRKHRVTYVYFERFFQTSDVLSWTVKAGNLRGMFFLPPGEGRFPGVLDMYGSSGGLIAMRAALLASRGFAVLALAYFAHDDLPSRIHVNLEYFESAVNWLHHHPCVLKTGVGVVGLSKGGALALHLATVSDKVKAVVAINCRPVQATGIHYYSGVEQPMFKSALSKPLCSDEGYVSNEVQYTFRQEMNDFFVPIEKSPRARFLLIGCEDDTLVDVSHAKAMFDRLRQHGKTGSEMVTYPGAGHMLEPPFTPLLRAEYDKLLGVTLLCGGEAESHAAAQVDAWIRIQSFLWRELCPSRQPPPPSSSETLGSMSPALGQGHVGTNCKL